MPVRVDESRPNDLWLNQFLLDQTKIAEFLHRYHLAPPPSCCGTVCTLAPINNRREQRRNQFLFIWVCASPNPCNQTQSFLLESYLFRNRLQSRSCALSPIDIHIRLLYKFYIGRNARETAKELGIERHQTVVGWFRFFRQCIHHWMQHNFYPSFMFDGAYAIQWDETCVCKKQKHHRGNTRVINTSKWVVGGVQLETGLCVMKHVRNRSAASLEAVIVPHSPNGATQITDCWRGYSGLGAAGFVHYNVNHEFGFVDPLTGYDTNGIEGLWALLHNDLKRFRGVMQSDLQMYLDEFSFRRNMRKTADGLWIKMLLVIGYKQNAVPQP